MSDALGRGRAASLSPLDREDRYIKRNERSIASLVSLLVHLLFVLARVLARADGHGEVLWKHERRRG